MDLNVNYMALILQKIIAQHAEIIGEGDNQRRILDANEMENAIINAAQLVHNSIADNTPIKKFLFVEDGSVDMEELGESLSQTNPEIKIIVYRQGSAMPCLRDLKDILAGD